MKIRKLFFVSSSSLVLGVLLSYFIGLPIHADGDASKLGSAEDPLVTKSYVDQQFKQAAGGSSSTPATYDSAQIKKWITDELSKLEQTKPAEQGEAANSSSLSVIKLEQGQTLFAGGGTEILVRTGKAVVVSTDENGVPDITAGKDLSNGTGIDVNHLLVFPREGRGIKADPKNNSDIYVMVRGTYLLIEADQK